MKFGALAVSALALVFSTAAGAKSPAADAPVPVTVAAEGTLQPLFAPWDDIEKAIVDTLGTARRQILVQAYLLTNKKISAALIAAHRRGVDVRVLVDGDQLDRVESSTAPRLASAGIPVWIETKYQNAHNKVIVIDAGTSRAIVMTGSFNFTWTAQHKNAENLLIARDNPKLAARYAQNWERHRNDASPYKK
ncbi:phospholipase D family protein [Noviherbaspirillum malthae]|jgi:phosphatidylserine/phosphatidylglycerophosphate/cardiolipin synthase-like enzyme|uniref:phospholipase D family nuclease n=1 Tax=Noviherbaspirillum malthae TaxID=1260987 RepID=UPI00188DF2D9|nr:phospholipase D family protein [Noviherbaspirillum malthae]